MLKAFLLFPCFLLLVLCSSAKEIKETSPKATAKPANPTGTYKSGDNELKVQALADDHLKISLVAYWPKKGAANEHVGQAEGTAELKGNEAVLYPITDLGPEEMQNCQIILDIGGDRITVRQKEARRMACEFGANVTVDGIYLKTK